MATPILNIPTLTTSQSNKEVTINEAIAFLETASVGLKAFTDTDTAASGLTVAGDDLIFGAYSFSGETVAVDIEFPGTARTFAVWNKNTVTLTVSVDAGVITHDVEPDSIVWFVTDGAIALALSGGGTINNNYVATTDPGVNDDVDQTSPGPYSVGSKWVNVTLDTAYICVDSTNAAAVWNQIDASGGLSDVVGDATPQLGGFLDANSFSIKGAKGADVASATALPLLSDGNYVDVTGTTTITSFNTVKAGTMMVLHFDAILILTHHATDLILPTGANITTAAGDEAIFIEYATDDWRCVNYSRADGTPLVAATPVSQYFSIVSFDYTTNTAIGDGAGYFHIPPDLNGMNLTYVHAEVITAGVTGTLDVQVHNVTDAVDMLSTKVTIDTTETGSDTAATPAVIDTTNDDVATNDLIRIDVDAIHTGTAAKGLLFTLGFETP